MWRLRVYNPANDTLLGTLSEAYGVSATFRLGTLGVLSFNVDMESSADLALLQHMRVVRIYDDVLEQELPEAFLVHDTPAASSGDVEPEPDAPSSVSFQCPTLGAWLGTSQKGGAVLYPRRGLTGRKRDPRAFGWQAADYDDSAWATAVSLGTQASPDVSSLSGFPAGWLDDTAEWVWSRALDDGVHPSGTSYFRTTLNHEGLVRVSFTANTSGVLWIDEDKALETDPDDRFAFKEFRYVDFDLDGETVFAVKATNRGGPAGIILSVVELDEEGEPTGDPLLITDNTWLTLDYPASVPGVTPGFLMDTVLGEAQARGAIPHLSWAFTGLVDSGNDVWSKEIAHQFRVGSKLGWVDEQVTQWAADSYVTEQGVYRLVNLRGTDLTGTATLHTLEDVRFQGEAPVANALLYLSSDDMAETDVASALDRIEEAVTFGTSDEVEALEEMAGLLLSELAAGHGTAILALSDAGAQPVVNFWVGDVVTHPGRDGTTTGRVTELVGTLDDGGVDWQVTCEFEDGGFTRTRARRLQEQLRETFDQTAGGRARLAHPKAGPSVGVPGGGKTGGGGGGFPATITVEGFGQEIPDDVWTPVDWVGATRNHLMSFVGDTVRLPVAGTWHVHDIELVWVGVDFGSDWLGGGARLRMLLDGTQVWPESLETATTPEVGLPVPRMQVPSVPTVPTLPANLTLEVRQASGEPQTLDRYRMSVSLREPDAAELPSPSFTFPYPELHTHGNRLWDTSPGTPDWQVVVNELSGMLQGPHAWDPSGRRVATRRSSGDAAANFAVVNVVTQSVESGWPDGSGWPYQAPGAPGDVDWKRDGSLIVVTGQRSDHVNTAELRVIDAATKQELPALFRQRTTENVSTGHTSSAVWEPDGQRLAWCPQRLVMLRLVAGEWVEESGWPTLPEAFSASWSPDGSLLLVVSRGEGYWVVDVATKQVTAGWPPLSMSGSLDAHCWSPDGSLLVVTQTSGVGSLMTVIDVETQTDISDEYDIPEVGIPVTGRFYPWACFSPDGSLFTFVRTTAGNPGLRILDAHTGDELDILTTKENGWAGSFAGASRSITGGRH